MCFHRRGVLMLLLSLCAIAAVAQHLDGYDTQAQVRQRMSMLALQDVEGLWQFPTNGSVIAIERDDEQATRFRIVAVDSPYLVVNPGELLGYAYPTTLRNTLDATLKEIRADGLVNVADKKKRHRFTLTLSDDAMIFKPVKKGFRLSWDWWRLFPYMFRIRVNKVDNRSENLDGALRLWPRSATVPPRQPRYL